MNLQFRIAATAFAGAVLVACGPSKPQPVPPGDYVVPKGTDVVELCRRNLSGKRAKDAECEAKREGYMWVYDLREGHTELPAVGENLYSNEVQMDKPLGVRIIRIPAEGGWWS